MFGKFFSRDYRYYVSQGDKYLAAERYADARTAFNDALEKMHNDKIDDAALEADIKGKMVLAGDRLGFVNLEEAEHAFQSGIASKAREHIHLVMQLAEDVITREKAEILLRRITEVEAGEPAAAPVHGCASCKGVSPEAVENSGISDEDLSSDDRFYLAIQTLPHELSLRYAGLGEEFACAYLTAHGGRADSALSLFHELNETAECDIYHYEISLIYYEQGDLSRCEHHLQRAIELNRANPLCWLALAQLTADTGRFQEALQLLDHMVVHQFLPDQARSMQGDIYQSIGAVDKAIDCYTELLAFPGTARIAAERLVPLLENQGRNDEAEFLFKKYLKGCC
ncbi:MAG: hypothetical protein CXR31_06690 [Geobacter sp.]|nr:MAG: hypothetical protein CXR31_06690 [Geobacter sp.]